MRIKINSTGEIKEVEQVGDKLFDKENNYYLLSQVTILEGWHPASEPPIVPEHYNWISVIAIVWDMDDNSTRATDATFNKDKGWIFPEFSNVLWWCYPPKEE